MQGKGPYEVGKGKPPKHAQFQRGESGNTKGKTSEQKLMEMANAQAATRIQARLLQALEGQMLEDDTKKTIVDNFIKAEVLKLVKDAQDRGLGTAKQSVDHTSTDGTMTPTREMSDAQLQAIIEANAKPR
jgi:ribosomal protein L7/L12